MQTTEARRPAGAAAASPGPLPWRDRLLPKTVLGLSMLLLSAAIGAAFSGTVLYAYYDYRLNKNEQRVSNFINNFGKNYTGAIGAINAARDDAKSQIKKELEPLQRVTAEGSTLENLLKQVAPSIWFVHTLDDAGQPSVGSAFVVASDSNQTLLLTSWSTIRAATHQPGPPVFVRQGDQDVKATLWTWQDDHDLALLIIDKPNQKRLTWNSDTPATRTGDRVFAVSGLGTDGGAITQGFVADVSATSIQTDAPVGTSFQGGPLLNSKGEVLGLASRAYAPLGFTTEGVYFAIPIHSACDKVLRCPSGEPNAPGQKG